MTISDGLIHIGLAHSDIDRCTRMLDSYVRELELFNSAYDLIGTASHEEIIVRHIFDSLAPYQFITELCQQRKITQQHKATNTNSPIHIADVGSGAGLPGIPLAIVFQDVDFVLIERMSKRCAFLENCIAILGLSNVRVENTELEKVLPESVDIAVFRAFRPLDNHMIRSLLRLITSGGFLAAYKGKKSKIDAEMASIAQYAPQWVSHPLDVPFGAQEERHLVVIEKN